MRAKNKELLVRPLLRGRLLLGVSKALAKATVKKTGMRKIHANELVVPAGLAKQLKKVAKRKGVPIKRKKKGRKKK